MAKKKSAVRVRPLYDRVVVRRLDTAEQTSGSIIIPDSAKEKPLEAEIVAVGCGKRLDDGSFGEMLVKVGDTVLVGKYGGTEIKLDGEEFLIVREDEVLGIIG